MAEFMSELPHFLGPSFERACADWLYLQDDLPIAIRTVDQWWGNNPIKRREEEIDIVAPDFSNQAAIIGECKWRKADKIKPEMVDTLMERSLLVPEIKERCLYFFVKECSGHFAEYAKSRGVTVVKYEDFFA